MTNWVNVFDYILIGAFFLVFAFLGNVLIGDPLRLIPDSPFAEEWECRKEICNEYATALIGDINMLVGVADYNACQISLKNNLDWETQCIEWIKVRTLRESST